jgi:hypothetical protein
VPLLVSIVKDEGDDESIRIEAARVLKVVDPEAAKKALRR